MDISFRAYLQLIRPANCVTAIADVWAGFALVGGWTLLASGVPGLGYDLLWLSFSTLGLYGGGVAFNDIADAALDAVERPERPIPSGKIKKSSATFLAGTLLILGVLAAFQVNSQSGILAGAIAACALSYDYWGKHQSILGPFLMGLCRAGNLLLGAMVLYEVILDYRWMVGFVPLVYVAGITLISRGEVQGKNRDALLAGLGIYGLVLGVLFFLAFRFNSEFWQVIPFLGLLAYMIFPPLIRAIWTQSPQWVGKSVKAAVISLVLVNASLSVAFENWMVGLLILGLLPVSLGLAKYFAVT